MTAPTTTSLSAFLLDQIEDDEAAAQEASQGWPGRHWRVRGEAHEGMAILSDSGPDDFGFEDAETRHVQRHDPAHVLAVSAAHKSIVEMHRASTDHGDYDPYCVGCWEAGGMDGAPSYPCPTLRALASAYRDREGWREGWA